MRRLLLVALLVAACSSSPAIIDAPPPGVIWFGRSFDTTTFKLDGKQSQVDVQKPFSFVASLPKTMDGSEILLRLSYNGTLIATQASGVSGSGDVFGFTPSPLTLAGPYLYELTDVGGNVLASGTITAR